jgi:predicted nicotinamide N-methyase
MPTAPQIDAPLSLGSFFPDSDDEEEVELDPCYETQEVVLASETLRVRQYAWHSHNANRVWPGTFNLADYLFEKDNDGNYRHSWGRVLELGTATGLLAIRLALASRNEETSDVVTSIVTSDVDDEQGDVEQNVRYNFELNGFSVGDIPVHVPHTWGTGWNACAQQRGLIHVDFDTIVASDILLYISAYAALVDTLEELMLPQTKFVMSWNRRMKESQEFFERMERAGFSCRHEGKCVYTFQRKL